MNIFATSPDPRLCAQDLDDKRVVKMTLETGQIISTARHLLGLPAPYKPTHQNHPCVLWALNEVHMQWLLRLLIALSEEYNYRFNKSHKTGETMAELLPAGWEHETPNYFVNCTTFQDLPVHEAYKRYLCWKWIGDKRVPVWTRRGQPRWR
jgi:hypothetical protein